MNILTIFAVTILLIVKFCENVSNTNLKDDIYIKNANISCCLEDHGPMTEKSCSLLCTVLDQRCNGFDIINSKCNLCFICGGSSNSVTFISGYAKYQVIGR